MLSNKHYCQVVTLNIKPDHFCLPTASVWLLVLRVVCRGSLVLKAGTILFITSSFGLQVATCERREVPQKVVKFLSRNPNSDHS